MKRYLMIGLVATLCTTLGSVFAYKVGHWNGRKEGWAESERHTTKHSLAQRTESLRLIRSGEVDAGVTFLDHTLDVDILIAAGRSPLCCAPQIAVPEDELRNIVDPVVTYRAKYPRLPYDKGLNVSNEVDRLLSEIQGEPPNHQTQPIAGKPGSG